jgi:hypothetical protein
LNGREVSRTTHYSAERVNFTHEAALGDASDSGITGHLADCLKRARDNRHRRTGPRGRDCSFGTRVSRANDDYVEVCLKQFRTHHPAENSLFSGMPLKVPAEQSTVFIRRAAFETAGLNRSEIDSRFNLTDAEFRIEGDLIALGPLPSDDDVPLVIAEMESRGLVYFEDFFELSGNWPEWLAVFVQGARG